MRRVGVPPTDVDDHGDVVDWRCEKEVIVLKLDTTVNDVVTMRDSRSVQEQTSMRLRPLRLPLFVMVK
jgi:hypothetical protein